MVEIIGRNPEGDDLPRKRPHPPFVRSELAAQAHAPLPGCVAAASHRIRRRQKVVLDIPERDVRDHADPEWVSLHSYESRQVTKCKSSGAHGCSPAEGC